MLETWSTVLIAILVLAAAVPYVAWVRHPEQRPFAAYLVFVSVFAVAAVVLFVLIGWLADALGLIPVLGQGGLTVALLLLGVLPALGLATWQARKPPMERKPPD